MDSKKTDLFLQKIKECFNFFKKDIRTYLIEATDTTYDFKTDINDGLLYLLLYTQKNNTKTNSAITISKFKKISVSRQAFDKRSDLIKLNDLNKINNLFYKNFLSQFESDFNITDGIAINVYDDKEDKGYKKVLLMSVVDSKSSPQDLHINKDIYKSEIKLFYDLLEKGYYNNNKTFIFDALYFSDKLTNKLYDKNLKFISRMKNNSIYLAKYNTELKNNIFIDDYEITNSKGNKVRIINYKVNNKVFHIATNLLDKQKFSISYFKDAYKKRWDVELYIKITKANTNLETMKTKDDIKREIMTKSILLVTMIYNYFICLYKKYSGFKETDKKRINNSQFIKSFYSDILCNIIKGKFNKKELTFLFSLFFILYVDSNKKNNVRKAIMPYRYKWHYKETFVKMKD